MKKQDIDINYYKNLPKKRMATGAIIFNKKNEILIVKPSYKNYWSITGGVVDDNESPRSACTREIEEELGLKLKKLEFISVDYYSNRNLPEKGEALQFIFFGGKLSEKQIKKIRVDRKEIIEYKFLKVDDALNLLGKSLKIRVKKSLEILRSGVPVYLEEGKYQ